MCNSAVVGFVLDAVGDVEGLDVLEIGSRDVDGTVRPLLERAGARSYVGVDIVEGPGVDVVLDASQLGTRFPDGSFDLVVCTEVLEHVVDWRAVIDSMKAVVKPAGQVVLTTRAPGFPLHGYPQDYWRFDETDMRAIFGDFDDVRVERDPEMPGVFVSARTRRGPAVDLDAIDIRSALLRRPVRAVTRPLAVATRVAVPTAERMRELVLPRVPEGMKRRVKSRLRHWRGTA